MSLKERWRQFRPHLLSSLAYGIVRTLGGLARIHTVGFEKLGSFPSAIVCGWHGKSLLFANYYRKRGAWVIISHSRDGNLQSSIFQRLGYRIIRGSTGRGGVRAAVEGIRALKAGGLMAVTPDGPRGPHGVVQGGVMTMAQKSGAVLIPIGISARWRIVVNSWDHYMVPLPFTPAIMVMGDPIPVPVEADETKVEELRLLLESEIHRLEAEAERAMGH